MQHQQQQFTPNDLVSATVQPTVLLDHMLDVTLDHTDLSRIQRLVRRVQEEHELEFDPTIVSYVAERLQVEPMSIDEVEDRLWTAMSDWSSEAGAPRSQLTELLQRAFE